MKAMILAVGMLMAACTPPPPPAPVVTPAVAAPPGLRRCPDGRPPPPAPPPPRTLQQIMDWVAELHAALLRSERARAECASRLVKLNDWITEKL